MTPSCRLATHLTTPLNRADSVPCFQAFFPAACSASQHTFSLSYPLCQAHIELAALAVGNPSELASIMGVTEPGDSRVAALHAGFMKLPSSMRDLKREVVSLVESGKLSLLKITTLEPLEMAPAQPQYQEVRCKRFRCTHAWRRTAVLRVLVIA